MRLALQGIATEAEQRRHAPKALAKAAATGETVATYLNKRLRQIGVSHVFAIPGDYIEGWVSTLDDPTSSAGLVRVHPNNEVSATYAADAMGRSAAGTVGCAAFTYGVGALNAAQAVAGAYVERVPLVLINGSPSLAQVHSERDQGVLYHHMISGERTDQRVFAEVTELAVRLDNPATAPELIDAALTACLTSSRPVYIEIVNQIGPMACRPVPEAALRPAPIPASTSSLNEATRAILAHVGSAKRLVVIAGAEIMRRDLGDKLARLLKAAGAPYVSSALGKGVLDERREDLRFSGVYFGKSSQENVQRLTEAADCILALGVLDTDFNYLGVVTPDYDPTKASRLPGPTHIQARDGAVLVGRGLAYWGDVDLEPIMDALITGLEAEPPAGAPFPGLEGSPWEIPATDRFEPESEITWDSFKSHLYHNFLSRFVPDDYPQIVADSGFSFVGMSNLPAAERGYVAQLAWAAIGYGVGAMAGAALARGPRRTVGVAGDAAFAETVNALGTIAQLGQDSVLFVMDNRVYAVEQWLIDANAFCPGAPPPAFLPLTQVPQGHIWDYVKLAEGFGGIGRVARTNAELRAVLNDLVEPPINPMTGRPTFTLVDVRIPAQDLPDLTRWKMRC